MTDRDKVLKLRDMYCAAYLISVGLKLVRLANGDEGQYLFVFEDVDRGRKLESDYYRHRALGDPFAIALAIKEIKDLLYAKKRI